MTIKVGDTVRLKRPKQRAMVVELLPDIGWIKLDRSLESYFSWPPDDLELAPKFKKVKPTNRSTEQKEK